MQKCMDELIRRMMSYCTDYNDKCKGRGTETREEKSEWSEPVVLHAVGREERNNLGIAFEES